MRRRFKQPPLESLDVYKTPLFSIISIVPKNSLDSTRNGSNNMGKQPPHHHGLYHAKKD
jgi:hypothetical protein